MTFQKNALAMTIAMSLTIGLTACNSDNDNDSSNAEAQNFNRIATFPVCLQLDDNCHVDDETAAEIVAASVDGNTLIYSNSPNESLGFVDISDPSSPMPIAELALGGEPTSVTVLNDYALVAINTSEDYVNVSGALIVVDIATRSEVARMDLGGQPDSIAASPSGDYVAVVIENERDEDFEPTDGAPVQLPAGGFIIIDTALSDPADWTRRNVDMTGLATLFPSDPEPEYVDINDDDMAVITLQENNHIVVVDLASGEVMNHFSAGTVDLVNIDTEEEDAALISLTSSASDVPREPDGVTWISNDHFVTADEGDLYGGSRGFTIFDKDGTVVYSSGNTLDHLAVKLGHYPDARSGNKGNEPENAEYAMFGDDEYLFVNSERSSLIFVYDVENPEMPELKQILPTAAGPEGVLAIPSRDLLIAASEVDERGDKLRSALNIYQLSEQAASYPTLQSADVDGLPIAWSALSGLAAHPTDANILYTVNDSYYQQNRIFTIDVSQTPATITASMKITDSDNVLASIAATAVDAALDDDDAARIETFDSADLAALINSDKTINIDPEGIAVASDGGFWVASEGAGTIGDEDRPLNSLNFIFKVSPTGAIQDVVTLGAELNAMQVRFGLEGITEHNGKLYAAVQRAWGDNDHPVIFIYDIESKESSHVFYPLDDAESQNGGWVGLSDITAMGDDQFLVLERDNQGGPDAAIKRIYSIDLSDVEAGDTINKTLEVDLMDTLAATGAMTFEKIEGLAVTASGEMYILNDNDGVKDNSGETQLLKVSTAN
ncbi:esterase-like activity of phytase family protein [Echinimonas agarilytica]|uniref:Esterase-like activity of phytase family protein n=1 Tax=Echinimonas agarilytica TaxID=1215918 RepID=A0AA41W7P8_9GAMM|nr:esterase-like activity of phytase family protein [Echinimonas agarilytica]MCM2680098.1 esterase-like activity of phytase family protein [Echinimonas agarilytica]